MLSVRDPGFVPRISLEMSYHPDVIHLVSRGRYLLVALSGFDAAETAVGRLEHFVPVETGPEAGQNGNNTLRAADGDEEGRTTICRAC